MTTVNLTLTGPIWRLVSYGPPDNPQAVIEAGSVTAGFFPPEAGSDTGRVNGSTGCNAYFSTYQIDGETLTVGPAGSTRRACLTPEGIMEQEQDFLTALQAAESYQIESDQLTISYDSGAGLLTFSGQ